MVSAVPRSLVHVFNTEVWCFTWAFAFVGLKLRFRQRALNCFIVVVLFVPFTINTSRVCVCDVSKSEWLKCSGLDTTTWCLSEKLPKAVWRMRSKAGIRVPNSWFIC